MLDLVRFPLVAAGFAVDLLRRMPGASVARRLASAAIVVLVLGAVAAFLVWGAEKAPLRLTLAQLAGGELPSMQSWIIVSGDLVSEPSRSADFRYRMTDPGAPNASMVVLSAAELAPGYQTVSGTYSGPTEGVALGYPWIGLMRADLVQVPEQPPPWPALSLAGTALLIVAVGRLRYPVFFAEIPQAMPPRVATLMTGIQRESRGADHRVVPGTLRVQPDEPVILRVQGAADRPLRLHSALSSVAVGKLRRVSGTEPVLRVQEASGEFAISFASRADRDLAFAALTADMPGQIRDRGI